MKLNYFFTFQKKNKILEELLINSNLNQINILWTILQPVSHRDFFYSGKFDYPGYSFAKISTPVTRLFKVSSNILIIKSSMIYRI